MKVKSLSPVRLLATPWTGAHQAPPLMGFSRQEYWSGVPLPSPHSPATWANDDITNGQYLEMLGLLPPFGLFGCGVPHVQEVSGVHKHIKLSQRGLC